MYRRISLGVVLPAIILLAGGPVFAQPGPGRQKPKGKVDLVSSVEGIVPGRPFDVALHFQLPPGWHIYWQNSGESGLPPSVTWSLPSGFRAGDLQYPMPKRHVAPGDIVTNVLDGEPILLVRITPPDVINVGHVVLAADVQYLICEKTCLREATKLAVELPVLETGSKTTAAGEGLFTRARRALPKEKSKYLSIVATTEPKDPAPGRAFDFLVSIDVKRGFHIQSHEPLNPSFIKSDVFLEKVGGVRFKDPIYPPPKFRTLKYVGKVSEYAGRFTVRVPGEVDEEATATPRRLGGLFKYQACNNKGTCFPPDALAFAMTSAALIGAGAGANAEPPPAGAGKPEQTPQTAVAAVQPSQGVDEALPEDDAATGALERFGLLGLLLIGCFLYGLFINATPCVLPLLSIKVLGFVQQAHESRRRTLYLGLAFGAGVMIFFVVLGFLASAGKNVLQYPGAVIGLGTVVMVLALSMLGVYTLQAPTAATKLDASIQKEGLASSFGKGALAPVLGFACTGPLLAGAFGWATQQPPHMAVIAFAVAGLGMASPYMLLGANPNWLSFLPRPGPWMVTFERIMGFVLLGMVIWLLHPLITQIGVEGLEWTLAFLVAIGLACWLLGKVNVTMEATVRWKYRAAATTIAVGAGVVIYGWIYPLNEAGARQNALRIASYATGGEESSEIPWRLWSREAVEQTVRSGKTVFVDFTAAYCTECKVNKAVAINRPEFLAKLNTLGVVPFQADFTSGDPVIFAGLQEHERLGPPLNVIYPAGKPDEPIVLKVRLSRAYLLQKLDEAGPSLTASVSTAGT